MITERDPSPAEQSRYSFSMRMYALCWLAIGLGNLALAALDFSLHRSGGTWLTIFGVAFLGLALAYHRRSLRDDADARDHAI